MKHKSIVSEKGQVTLPKEIRERFGIHPGVEIEFRSENGVVTIVKIIPKAPISKWYGSVKKKKFSSTDEYMKKVRGEDCN
jgi:antitoxin PrlF